MIQNIPEEESENSAMSLSEVALAIESCLEGGCAETCVLKLMGFVKSGDGDSRQSSLEICDLIIKICHKKILIGNKSLKIAEFSLNCLLLCLQWVIKNQILFDSLKKKFRSSKELLQIMSNLAVNIDQVVYE